MAKKATTNRVHKIAKKLGVGSKDIVAKCESEGILDITNHMSAVSAGLEATITEWFSEDGDKSSAVETAEKVNIKKVKAKQKKKAKKKTHEECLQENHNKQNVGFGGLRTTGTGETSWQTNGHTSQSEDVWTKGYPY